MVINMCVFDVLHFLPLLMIVGLFFSFRKLSNFFAITLILSFIGLLAGNHCHEAHNHFFGLSDPCFMYAGIFSVSVLGVIKKLHKIFIRINAR